MKIITTSQLFATTMFMVLLAIYPCCNAQVLCGGMVSGIITSNVVCTGGCILNGATVSGSVLCSTGSLVAKGGSTINGNVLISGTVTTAELNDATVLGLVEVKDAASFTELVVQQAATLGSVSVLNTPGDTIISGSITSLSLVDAGDLFVDKLTNLGSISVQRGVGIVEICGSFIGGGLTLLEHDGDVTIDADAVNCDPTTLVGSFSATKGFGKIIVRGANLSVADFIVLEHTGDVTLTGAQVSDVNVKTLTGSLDLRNVITDSDAMVSDLIGDLLLKQLDVTGDFTIARITGSATVMDSDFNLEDVSIMTVSNDLLFQNNIDLNLSVQKVSGLVQILNNNVDVFSVTENSGGVEILNNVNLSAASVNKNTGGVEITGNNIGSISCADNTPFLTGSGNTIVFGDGQCADPALTL